VLYKNHQLLENHLAAIYQLKQRHINIVQKAKHEYMCLEINEEKTNYQNYSHRRRRDLKKKHSNEIKQHPKNLKQQQLNIRKEYKNQYNVQNREYKLYREKILTTTPKDQVKDKLEQIKDEQNRKFSLLYEHYKKNVDSVYQEQHLKLNSAQQMEHDTLNEDLARQMKVLEQSHVQRKDHQAEIFAREIQSLENDRMQKHKDLMAKINTESDDLENSSKLRLFNLSEVQRSMIEAFDRECFEQYGIQMQAQNNRYVNLLTKISKIYHYFNLFPKRYSMYNISGHPQRSSSITSNNLNGINISNNNSHVLYHGGGGGGGGGGNGNGTDKGSDSVISTSREYSSVKSSSNSKFKF